MDLLVQGLLLSSLHSPRTPLEGAKGNCKHTSECQSCWARTKAYNKRLRQREEEHQRSQDRARLKAKKITRRAKRRELFGSDSDSHELPPSPTWSELQFGIIQTEGGFHYE